ncbi:NifU-like protein involved in Fe-S cluster formation [Sphingomonas vulcanisoli]|uniref:NifU-like protein involved in Fe-S cluster formation n=1 Tax=Sphingomonas vulcanisoli TaxID=1658060 RepID=A0ABX0TQE3_9SPHN|nr:iron-sulfur cluster assembly scaffold protein [Sphingomonas vulcanisoli]NIJ07749.1 NifU-like protein involved in Fe-S cluster formation [Sphingomonas vulcanisoli]
MTAALYNSTILRLATAIPHQARLEHPGATAERRSPVCGSRVTVDVTLDEAGRVAAIGQLVRACALGQASAALMGEHAIGKTAAELGEARDALGAFLAGDRDDPGAWPGLEIFAPARPHSARHPSIRLAFEAVTEAAERAGTGAA